MLSATNTRLGLLSVSLGICLRATALGAAPEDEGASGSAISGACPAPGDCCTAHATPGCDDATCCDDVCFSDDLCCFDEWNESCAAFAALLCPGVCGGPTCPGVGDCCRAHTGTGCEDESCCQLICTFQPACCEAEWDALCAGLAVELCTPLCDAALCPGEDSCCQTHLSPGCNREACCNTVCAEDLTCCTDRWAFSCRQLAGDLCASTVCACAVPGDFDQTGATDLFDFARFQSCFTGGGGGQISAPCACGDFDGDGHVDLADYARFAPAMTPLIGN